MEIPQSAEAAADSAVTPGSLVWYARLFAPPEQHTRIEALCGVWMEIRNIGERAREPMAARLRLAWWQEEIGLMATGRARHPRAQALQTDLPRDQQVAMLLRELIHGAQDDVAGARPADREEFDRYLFRSAGAAFALLARVLGAPPALALVAGTHTGAVVRCAELIAQLGPDVRRGRLRLPLAAADAAAFAQGDQPSVEALRSGIRLACELAEEERMQALEALRARPAAVLRFHRVQLALHARLLKRAERRLRRRGLPEAPIELPPLGRLWTAWRGARRSMRETK